MKSRFLEINNYRKEARLVHVCIEMLYRLDLLDVEEEWHIGPLARRLRRKFDALETTRQNDLAKKRVLDLT